VEWLEQPKWETATATGTKDFKAKNPKIKVKYDAIADEYMDVLKPDWLGTQQPTYLLDAFGSTSTDDSRC